MSISVAALRDIRKTPSKYRNRRTLREGILFDSKREADRWQQLRLLERAGQVRNIRRQVEFRLVVNGLLICKYRADFVYDECVKGEWRESVEDVKGYPNERYPLKKRLMKALFGIEIRET